MAPRQWRRVAAAAETRPRRRRVETHSRPAVASRRRRRVEAHCGAAAETAATRRGPPRRLGVGVASPTGASRRRRRGPRGPANFWMTMSENMGTRIVERRRRGRSPVDDDESRSRSDARRSLRSWAPESELLRARLPVPPSMPRSRSKRAAPSIALFFSKKAALLAALWFEIGFSRAKSLGVLSDARFNRWHRRLASRSWSASVMRTSEQNVQVPFERRRSCLARVFLAASRLRREGLCAPRCVRVVVGRDGWWLVEGSVGDEWWLVHESQMRSDRSSWSRDLRGSRAHRMYH